MSGLVDYLRARLDEEEQRERSKVTTIADAPSAEVEMSSGGVMSCYLNGFPHRPEFAIPWKEYVAQYCVSVPDAAALADIAAKRALIGDAVFAVQNSDRWGDDESPGAARAHGYATFAEKALETLAQVYADRDDFDPAWRK